MVNKFAENFAQQGQGNSLSGMLSRMKLGQFIGETDGILWGGGLHTENEVVDTSDLCCGDCAVLEWCKCS